MHSKYWWMANVQRIIRAYPELRERKDATQQQSTTASYSAQPRGSGAGRTTEMAALRGLEPEEERYMDAILMALDYADLRGPEIRRLVQLHYWRGYSMQATANTLHVTMVTASRWNGWICRKVAALLGLYVEQQKPKR